ncbi:hypothetical protein KFL_003060050 [Klebsormidium nitens]|uniref:DUF1308 domain-containing protein n=1 Tax=Klebsormidium nitens TaxID=105231 RepID=A0A1Y1IDD0_KLENI|nr:hypothetical protein KFL_003060050 [Klebsormidium nitens]|eukprot:GAQ86706.1 hypothetical protein KFL_003060050 [Klebsormidium nitens]
MINQDSKRRLQKHVQSELSYLSRATSGAGAELASVSSNLNHLEAIASLLKHPEISCVVNILQTISFQRQLLSGAASSLRNGTELCTAAVDLVCLFRGEPAWIVVSARNPDFVSWNNLGDEEKPSSSTKSFHGPSTTTSGAPLTSPGASFNSLKEPSKPAELPSEALSASTLSQTRRPRPTHDTCLKDRIAGLLDAARGSSQLHRPSKIVLYFARGLQASLQSHLLETFGAVPCALIKSLGFEISLNPDPSQERPTHLGSQVLDAIGRRLSADMAPDSEALAWSLVESFPSPTPPVRPTSPSDDASKGADGVSKEWIVLEDPCVPTDQSPCEKDSLASASGREEANRGSVVVRGGLTATGSRVRGQVMNAVRQLENGEGCANDGHCAAAENSTKRGQLEALQTAPTLEGSFVAIDGPEGSFESGDSLGPGETAGELGPGAKSPAPLEKGWVALRLGDDVSAFQSSLANGPSNLGSGSRGEDKEWVALSAAGPQGKALPRSDVTRGDEKGGHWIGVQQPGLTIKTLEAVPGEWVGVARSITESEQNIVPERTDRKGHDDTNGTKGDPFSGVQKASSVKAEKRTESKEEQKESSKQKKPERNGIWGNGTEPGGPSRMTAAPQLAQLSAVRCTKSATCGTTPDVRRTQSEEHGEDGSGLAEGRFRTLNRVPLSARPASWPAGLKLVNLDTTALVALVSGITNGAAEGLRTMPEQVFRERWKGNADFMRDQVEAELQYPQLPYLESVSADKALLVTQYVLREFVSIVSVVGGEEEQARAERVLKRCWLIADSPSDRLRSLSPSRAIKARHVAIFGTADAWSCPTLTSNAAFARAVQKQGVPLWVLEHRPSALVGC